MLYMGLQISQDLPVMGFNTTKCDVLYLSAERIPTQDFVTELTSYPDTGSPNLYLTIMSDGIETGIEEQTEYFLSDYPETKFIITDTSQKIRNNNKPARKQGSYGEDYDDIFINQSDYQQT